MFAYDFGKRNDPCGDCDADGHCTMNCGPRIGAKMKETATTNAMPDEHYRSPDDIVKAILAFAKGPTHIGTIAGLMVYVDGSLSPGEIEFRHRDGRIQRVSIDHPYIQGTKLEAEARKALAHG